MIPLLISLVAILFIIFLYRKNLVGLVLRVSAIVLLYLVATNFSFNIPVKSQPREPVLLVDCSKSVERYFDDISSKLDSIKFPHKIYFFAESLYTSPVLKARGNYTDITTAIRRVMHTAPNILLLISDGNHNFGESPLGICENIHFPIFSFGIGKPPERDIAISSIAYPEYAFFSDTVRLAVEVESRGFSGEKGEVHLKSQKREQRKFFPLSDVLAKNIIKFEFLPGKLGKEKLNISIPPRSGEYTFENNHQNFSIDILKSKINTLYYTHHLSFNTRFILNALRADKFLELTPVAALKNGGYIDIDKQTTTAPPQFDKYDVIIFDNVNLSKIPINAIEDFLKKNGGVLFTGSCEGITAGWNKILPIRISGRQISGNFSIKILRPFSNLSPTDEYPPLNSIGYPLGVDDNATVIAEAETRPIIAYKNYHTNIVFQINTMNLGIWNFLQTGVKKCDLLPSLLSDVLRFISSLGVHPRLVLRANKKNYQIGNKILLRLQSYDRNFKPKGGGDFYLCLDDRKLPFFEVEEGSYEAELMPKNSGKFELTAIGRLNEETLHSNRLELNVLPQIREVDKGLNRQLLAELSERSGGQYYTIEKLRDFKPPNLKENYTKKRIEFNIYYIYIIIFILLTIDWIRRRTEGMI